MTLRSPRPLSTPRSPPPVSQSSRIFELRAACDLARLWADRGERRNAHDVLAPVYGWFTEGFKTADLKDAKALLQDLA